MKPVELYKFVQGATIWTYTSSDTLVTHVAEDYLPIAIGRSKIDVKNEMAKANLDIYFPTDQAETLDWLRGTYETPVTATIFRKTDINTLTIWKGRMAAVKPEIGRTTVMFESVFTSMRRAGLRRRFLKLCNHVLYQGRCGLDKDDFAEAGTVTARDGLVLTVTEADAQPDGWFTGGMIKTSDNVFRWITKHVGTQITLSRIVFSLNEELLLGDVAITMYPGCDRLRGTCFAKFDNLDRNGSFPFIPLRNPFEGNVA